MKQILGLETKRLILRQWIYEDFEAFAKLNSDLKVMEYFPSILTKKQSYTIANNLKLLIFKQGWGIWVLQEKKSGKFVGTLGLYEPIDNLPFVPCVEISWKLSYEYWGKGYASEASKEVLKFAFDVLKLDEVISFTAAINKRSISLMKRLGMKNTCKNFKHPALTKEDRLSEHVLYKIKNNVIKN